MSTVGTLTEQRDGSFAGRIRTRTMGLQLVLVPADKRSDASPDFTVLEELRDGATVELGGAWKRTANSGGGRYMSIALDDPSFPSALNLSAFPGDDPKAPWEVVWTRPKGRDDR